MRPFDRASAAADDPALEADLQQLRLADQPLPPRFTATVLAALTPYPAPVAREVRSVRAWWRGQAASLGLALLGLAIMLGTADLAGVLTGWWSAAETWLANFATDGSNALDLALTAFTGSAGAPQAGLGLTVGALILALGAGGFLVRNLAVQTT